MALALLLNCTQLLGGYTQHLYLMSLLGTFTGSAVMGWGSFQKVGVSWGEGMRGGLGGKEKERRRGQGGVEGVQEEVRRVGGRKAPEWPSGWGWSPGTSFQGDIPD